MIESIYEPAVVADLALAATFWVLFWYFDKTGGPWYRDEGRRLLLISVLLTAIFVLEGRPAYWGPFWALHIVAFRRSLVRLKQGSWTARSDETPEMYLGADDLEKREWST